MLFHLVEYEVFTFVLLKDALHPRQPVAKVLNTEVKVLNQLPVFHLLSGNRVKQPLDFHPDVSLKSKVVHLVSGILVVAGGLFFSLFSLLGVVSHVFLFFSNFLLGGLLADDGLANDLSGGFALLHLLTFHNCLLRKIKNINCH